MLKYIFKLCKLGESVKVNPVFFNTVKQNKVFKKEDWLAKQGCKFHLSFYL